MPTGDTKNLLIFHSGGLDCAFPLESVREVAPMATLSSPPGMPLGLAGFLDLRGTAVPILRLERLFGLPEQPPGLHTPMIVLHGAGGPIGVLVNSVRAIVAVDSEEFLDIPADRTVGGCATGAFALDGDLIHVLSADALLTANETRLVEDLAAMAQEHLLLLSGPLQSGREERN